MTSLLPSVLPSSTRIISNGRVREEGCTRMTESKLSMRGGRFSRSSLMGTMTEAQGRGPSVIKADWIDISGPRRRSRPHSIEGLDDGQLRTIDAVAEETLTCQP